MKESVFKKGPKKFKHQEGRQGPSFRLAGAALRTSPKFAPACVPKTSRKVRPWTWPCVASFTALVRTPKTAAEVVQKPSFLLAVICLIQVVPKSPDRLCLLVEVAA